MWQIFDVIIFCLFIRLITSGVGKNTIWFNTLFWTFSGIVCLRENGPNSNFTYENWRHWRGVYCYSLIKTLYNCQFSSCPVLCCLYTSSQPMSLSSCLKRNLFLWVSRQNIIIFSSQIILFGWNLLSFWMKSLITVIVAK